MDGLLKQATEDIRVLSEEVQTKSAALGKEKSENEAAAGIIERMKIDFELKLEEREEKLTKMFMRNQLNFLNTDFHFLSNCQSPFRPYAGPENSRFSAMAKNSTDKSEINAIKQDNTLKAQVTILDTEFKKHTADFHMIQSMNDANSMQHEEARRQAMKAVKQRLDEISRKLRFVLHRIFDLLMFEKIFVDRALNNTSY